MALFSAPKAPYCSISSKFPAPAYVKGLLVLFFTPIISSLTKGIFPNSESLLDSFLNIFDLFLNIPINSPSL
ncbi:hypothetical protein [Spiroplasma endosymbiont of Aspidapion aeneum]|uniref:hypothetical protein n=1 Tax=Spiroplasma endosymbiont of Aspidapion aeneum TaxID=3066276 RepID=UPI00313EC332